jgi:histidinol-phosphate aminotransferase
VVGGVGVPVPLDRTMRNDLAAMSAEVHERTREVFLVNTHNPTGTVMDAGQLRRFVREVSKRALVIVDEAYLEFSNEYAERTLADLVRGGGNVIVFRTFAKAYGLAGMDIGYGLVPKDMSQILKKRGMDNPHLFNRVAVAAATASLDDTGYVAAIAAKVARERNLWFGLLQNLKLKFTESSGNFVFIETDARFMGQTPNDCPDI